MNGLLNLAFPLFNALDGLLAAFLPAFLRVVFWGGIAGASAMALYWLLSDQAKVRAQQERLKAIRAEIKTHQDDFAKVMALSKQNLAASMRLLGGVLGPGLLSGLPVIFVIAWISTYYTYAVPPPGTPVPLDADPAAELRIEPETAAAAATSLRWPENGGEARLADASGVIFEGLPLDPPVGVVHKHAWWNWLWGNEAGYLDADGAIESVAFTLPRLRLFEGGPGWLGTWEFTFFTATILVSILIKVVFRIA